MNISGLDRAASSRRGEGGGSLTDDGDVLALVGGDDPGEQLDAGERRHGDLGEHEVEGVGALPHHLPRLEPVRDRRHCRLPEGGREGVRIPSRGDGLTTAAAGWGSREGRRGGDSPR